MWQRWSLGCLFVASCNFTGKGSLGVIDAPIDGLGETGDVRDADGVDGLIDGPIDGPVDGSLDAFAGVQCPADPQLRICHTFDPSPLPASLPNGGAAMATTALTNVTSTPGNQQNAALLGATSKIMISTMQVPVVRTVEMWMRLDQGPMATQRMGLFDNNEAPGLALYYYFDTNRPASGNLLAHYLRCVVGGSTLYGPDRILTIGTWTAIACTCDAAGMHSLYIDGVQVAQQAGCTSGAIGAQNFSVGQDNVDGTNVADPWIGAIDGLRIWAVARTAAEILAPGW